VVFLFFHHFSLKEDVMKKFMGLVVVAVAIAMVGCSQSPVSSVSSPAVSLGSVDVVLNLGKTGMAKTSSVTPLSLDSVVMNLTATGETPIHSVTPVSGNAQTVVAKSFDLAPKTWSLTVTTYAMRYYPSGMPGMPGYSSPQIVHQGSTSFTVAAGSNPAVNLSISSQYSMLLIMVSPVPDSCNQVALYSGDSLVRAYSPWADTSFTVGSLSNTDTVKMIYNWLYVQSFSQYVQIACKG
jgi:hypothetical protein